jgi:tryptophanyl-tRNA synthetase
MNRLYAKSAPIFTVPEASILPNVATVIGLDGQKMSKSYNNTIPLFEDEKPLRKKIMGIVTDSTPVESPKDPTGSTIVALYRLFASDAEVAKLEEDFRVGGTGYGDFKKRFFEALWEFFRPMREKRAALAADPGHVEKVLHDGAQRARAVAVRTMERVRMAVGLR